MKKLSLFVLCLTIAFTGIANDGYNLWLQYQPVTQSRLLAQYRQTIRGLNIAGNSPTLTVAREELQKGLQGLLGRSLPLVKTGTGVLQVGTTASSPAIATLAGKSTLKTSGPDAYLIQTTG